MRVSARCRQYGLHCAACLSIGTNSIRHRFAGPFAAASAPQSHVPIHGRARWKHVAGLPGAGVMAVLRTYADNRAGVLFAPGPCLEADPLLDWFTLVLS